jgi:hypothetical protein
MSKWIRLTRQSEGLYKGELYAFQCPKCGASWKVYQQETHYVIGGELCGMRNRRLNGVESGELMGDRTLI